MMVRTILLTAVLLVALVPPTDAQIQSCGVVDVIFLNPDLNARAEAGVIEANGAFFAQFQVIGERAAEVEYIAFSFGTQTVPQDDSVCPPDDSYDGNYFSGQQILNYRADTDPSDGFFINLQTKLVPDGEYTAAVHAFDADDNELGRFWAQAVVENCSADASVDRCDEEYDESVHIDTTQPWPIILPGDGQMPSGDGFPSQGFTIEVAEELSDWEVILNGQDITAELEQWDGRLWDDDLKPGYGPFGLIGDTPVTAECNTTFPNTDPIPLHECNYLGMAFRWDDRKLETGDVLNVRLVDLAGNEAKKDVHVGYGITGGISSGSYPILRWQSDHVTAEVAAGSTETFTFTIQNLGTETGHPFARDELQQVPEGWDYTWSAHQPVLSGAESSNTFELVVPADASTGRQQVTVGMAYAGQNNQEFELQQILTIDVVGGVDPNSDLDPEGEGSDEKGSPGAGALLTVVALLGAAGVVARRRQ